jgi:hypothetical protein
MCWNVSKGIYFFYPNVYIRHLHHSAEDKYLHLSNADWIIDLNMLLCELDSSLVQYWCFRVLQCHRECSCLLDPVSCLFSNNSDFWCCWTPAELFMVIFTLHDSNQYAIDFETFFQQGSNHNSAAKIWTTDQENLVV